MRPAGGWFGLSGAVSCRSFPSRGVFLRYLAIFSRDFIYPEHPPLRSHSAAARPGTLLNSSISACASFPLPLRPIFPPFFLQGAEENPPTTTPPNLVRPSIPTPPSRHESLSRPIKQTTAKSVPVSVFV